LRYQAESTRRTWARERRGGEGEAWGRGRRE
jgi:hypothetical protein